MSMRGAARLPISPWPFILVAPAELYYSLATQTRAFEAPTPRAVLLSVATCLAALVVELAGVWLVRRFQQAPGSFTRWALEYALVTLAGTVAIVAIVHVSGMAFAGGPVWLTAVALARTANVGFLAFIIDGIIRQWHAAAASTAKVSATLNRVSRVNALLRRAKDSLFSDQARFLTLRILVPLQVLAARAKRTPDDELADEVDLLVSQVMRPLAHEMHPVTLSLGLLPALDSLNGRFHVTADAGVTALDAAGDLLDPEVRLQVYRWIRTCDQADSSLRLALSIRGRSLVVAATGLDRVPVVDSMMAVAGIVMTSAPASGAIEVAAPLKGQFVDQVLAGESFLPPEPEVFDASTVTMPPVHWYELLTGASRHRLQWTAVLVLGSIPSQIVVTRSPLGTPSALIWITWIAVPLLVSGLLGLVPVRPGSRVSAVWVVFSWVAVGVVSAGSELVASSLSAWFGSALLNTVPTGGFDLMRGLVRFTLAGLLITVGRGYAYRARANTDLLEAQLATAMSERADLLAESDRQERFIAEKLHRSVQGRLSAISLLLRLGQRERAIDELDLLRTATVPAIAAQMTQAWKATSTRFLDPTELPFGLTVLEAIDADALAIVSPARAAAIHRFAAECAVNARTHGGATRLEVSLQRDGQRLVLVCLNNGSTLSPDAVRGLGSALFDEVAQEFGGTWSYLPASEGVVVRALLPVGTGPPADASKALLMGQAG